MQRDSLGRLAGDLMGYVMLFRDAPETARPSADDLRAQLLRMFDALSSQRTAQSLDPNELDAARFALAAWADETILKSGWSGRDAWLNELLQTRLFGTNKGGDEFFDRLAGLSADFNHAREVFFLCLLNGFEGRMIGDDSGRHELTRQLYEMLRVAGFAKDAATERHLTESAYDLEIEIFGGSGRSLVPLVSIWLGATLVGIALLFLTLWLLAGGVDTPPEF